MAPPARIPSLLVLLACATTPLLFASSDVGLGVEHITCVAMPGTDGDDRIRNDAEAIALAELTVDTSATASTLAIGVDALGGRDDIANVEPITAHAESRAEVDMALGETNTSATATGVAAGDGDDTVASEALLTATAVADTRTTLVNFLVVDPGVTGAPTLANTTGTGIDGGNGGDSITNRDEIRVRATSVADATTVTVSAVASAVPGFGDARVEATSIATGIDAGTDDAADRIANAGLLAVDSSATASTGIGHFEGAFGAARIDGSTTAAAHTTGFGGGGGDDELENLGELHGTAVSSASVESGEVAFKIIPLIPNPPTALLEAFGLDVGALNTIAVAEITAVDAGDGDDDVANRGLIDVSSTATAESVTVKVGVAPPITASSAAASPPDVRSETGGLSIDDPTLDYLSAATAARATAVGLDGGDGDDELVNAGEFLRVTAESDAVSHSVNVSLAVSKSFGFGTALADAATAAEAFATGIAAGVGDDTIENRSGINAVSDAHSHSHSVGVGISGAWEGAAVGLALTDGSSDAMATACGIDAGSGSDTVRNTGAIHATSTATTDTESISVTAEGSKIGMAFGVAISDSSGRSTAESVGIDGGEDVDNSGIVDAEATSTSSADSVSVEFSAAVEGVVGGVAATHADTIADAIATGVRTAEGDDSIVSHGTGRIESAATASAFSESVSVSANAALKGVALGASLAETQTEAHATAAGIDSGAGDDTIVNEATLTSSADAVVDSKSISVTAAFAPKGFSAGVALARSGTVSEAGATGILGGSGDDDVTNRALVDVDSTASSTTKTVTINFAEIGMAMADVSSHATAEATGIDGGAGTDAVTNEGVVDVDAQATANDVGGTANFVGYASGNVESVVTAEAIGIAGSDLVNADTGSIFATAQATVDAEDYVVQGGGAAFAETGVTGTAEAIGMAGASAGDDITNDGSVDVAATANVNATSFSFQLAGVQAGSAGLHSAASATGIDGNSGDDTVTNTGLIAARSDVDSLAASVTGGFGVNVSLSGTTARGETTGIAAGEGDDVVDNQGTIAVAGTTSGDAAAGSIGLFSLTLSTSLAQAELIGIDGGAGDDEIFNSGTIDAGVDAPQDGGIVDSETAAISFDFFSVALTSLGASGNVIGILGGAGDDLIDNSGTVNAGNGGACDDGHCMVIGNSFGYGGQIAGSSNAYAGTSASVTATALDGGSGDDTTVNTVTGTLNVNSRSYADVDAETYEGFGFLPSSATSSANSDATSTGIQGGAGSDSIDNAGHIDVEAWTKADAWTEASVSLGIASGAIADSRSDAGATAIGVDLGAGIDELVNTGSIAARATAMSRSEATADSFTSHRKAKANATSTASAVGVRATSGSNDVTNEGAISVDSLAHANPLARGGSGWDPSTGESHTTAISNATSIGIEAADGATNATDGTIDVTARATGYADSNTWLPDTTATTRLTATATGIGSAGAAEADRALIANAGAIRVSAIAGEDGLGATQEMALVNLDDWVRSTRGTATGTSIADVAGIRLGDGDKEVTNTGTIEADAVASAYLRSFSDSRDYQAKAWAYPTATATATGIGVAGGDNVIRNEGSISSAATIGEAYGRADTWSNWSSCFSTTHTIGEAWATGIETGDGHDDIVNLGEIETTASAQAIADVWADTTFNWTADEYETATAEAFAQAIGIDAGAGLNSIENGGTIRVTADALAGTIVGGGHAQVTRSSHSEATAIGIRVGDGGSRIVNTGTISVEASDWLLVPGDLVAIGILGGDGNDDIVNEGTIEARTCSTLMIGYGCIVSRLGVAVSAGDGDDAVSLVGESVTHGSIDLGHGDDSLTLHDTALLEGPVFGGEGIDWLVLEDVDTCVMHAMDGIERIRLNDGTLEFHGDYSLDPVSVVETMINHERGSGQLCSVGGGISADGALVVEAAPRVFTDGQTFDVVLADTEFGLSGDFDQVTLPDATPFLEFGMERTENAIRVQTSVSPFEPEASNRVERSVAHALDSIATFASGDMSEVIGSFQLTAADEVPLAFSSLSPDSLDHYARTTFDVTRRSIGGLEHRLDLVRSELPILERGPVPRGAASVDTDYFAGRAGVWLAPLGQSGRWSGRDGFSGFEYDFGGAMLGYEATLPDAVVGASVGTGHTQVDFDGGMVRGDIDTTLLSVYAGRFGRRAFVQSILGYAAHDYDTRRDLVIGSLERTALGRHDGNSAFVTLSGGMSLHGRTWSTEPIASLRYVRLHEEAFAETGAGSAGLVVASNTTSALVTELGLRVSGRFERGRRSWLMPEFLAAWGRSHGMNHQRLTAALAGAPETPLAFEGLGLGDSEGTFGAGLTYVGRNGWAASFRYTRQVRDGDNADGLVIDLRSVF